MTEREVGSQPESLKNRINRGANRWLDNTLESIQRTQADHSIPKGMHPLIHFSRTFDILLLSALAEATGGRVIRSQYLAEKIEAKRDRLLPPRTGKRQVRIDVPQNG